MANHTDFNGDGRDDIFWRSNSGQMAEWLGQADGSFTANGTTKYPFPLGWEVVGTGDFNGDGHDDVLFQNLLTGAVTDWLGEENGAFFSNHVVGTYSLPTGWHVAGTGDFNGDGTEDLLLSTDSWQLNSVSGPNTVTEWLGQKDGTFVWNANATYTLDSSWHVQNTGDFNGDGLNDVLLRNNDGRITEWLGQAGGLFMSNHAVATYSLDNSWQVGGTGDFNGDGRDDVLLRSTEGSITEWLGQIDGGFAWNSAATYTLDPSWSVVAIGDYDGSGSDDVLLRNNDGTVTDWLSAADGLFYSNHENATYHSYDWTWQIQPNPGGAGIWDY